MAIARIAGIPDIKPRSDNSEEARQWNKMRQAVIALYQSEREPDRDNQLRLPSGFQPVPQIATFTETDALDPGIGMELGRLRFLQVERPTEVGADQKSVELIPTLEGESLDADPPPRKFLASGDYEAWVIWRELGSTHEARIVFATEDAGPGTLDLDEKAERLATFEVYYSDSSLAEEVQTPGVKVKKQFIKNNLAVPVDRHQFRVYKTASNKVKVAKGNLIYLKGLSDPLVSASLEASESAEITVTGNGSIWISASWSVYQHSESSIGSGVHLRMYRLDSLGSPSFSFRTSAPTRGTNSSDQFTSGTLWFEIAKVELVGGEVFVTDQIVNGPIYVNELVDGKISTT